MLRFVEDLLQTGTIMIFDDWHTFEATEAAEDLDQYGVRGAFQAWRIMDCFDEFYDAGDRKAFIMRREP